MHDSTSHTTRYGSFDVTKHAGEKYVEKSNPDKDDQWKINDGHARRRRIRRKRRSRGGVHFTGLYPI